MMWYVVWCVAALAVVLPPAAADHEMGELMQLLREICVEETGVDVRYFAAVNGLGETLPDEPGLKRYLLCVMETAGMYWEGRVDTAAVVGAMDDEERGKVGDNVRACGTQPGADDGDVVYNTQRCWQRLGGRDYTLI